MPNQLYNKYGNQSNYMRPQHQNPMVAAMAILNKYRNLQNNPGIILDELLNNGKITQQQYEELQPYRNNPEAIGRYLVRHGAASQINQAQQVANQIGGNIV